MTNLRCSVCANPMAKRLVNDGLREGVTAATLSRQFEGIGATVSAEVISRHRKHWQDDQPIAPKGTRKTDLAYLVREKAIDMFENGELDLAVKDHGPGITAGLRAAKIIDDREKEKAKTGRNMELIAALLHITGMGPAPLALDDGRTIDGEAVDVTDVPD